MNLRIRSFSKPRRTSASILLMASYFFLVAGIIALGYASYVYADAHMYQAVERSRFETTPRSEAPIVVMEGDVIGEIEIPRLGLQTIMVQGDSPRILRRAVGHIAETPLPGELGNVVLAGHRDGFFRPLRNIQPGDAITLKTANGDFQYQVESTEVVPPSDIQALQTSSGRVLTLITCYPFYYVGPAPNRFVVHAREINSPAQLSAH